MIMAVISYEAKMMCKIENENVEEYMFLLEDL